MPVGEETGKTKSLLLFYNFDEDICTCIFFLLKAILSDKPSFYFSVIIFAALIIIITTVLASGENRAATYSV
jgi:hypothetical protein